MKKAVFLFKVLFLLGGIIRFCNAQELGYGSNFHEFITLFSQKDTNQIHHISFPLLTIHDNDTSYISEKDWNAIDYCFGCEYSTILFMGDSIDFKAGYYKKSAKNGRLISVYLKPEKRIQNFYFSKIENRWVLNKIVSESIKTTTKEFFFDFLDRFSADANFVEKRTTEDFTETLYDFEQTPLKKIEIPFKKDHFSDHEYLFEKVYIHNFNLNSNSISIYIKGEGTGYHLEYYFERIDGKWFFSKHINLGV